MTQRQELTEKIRQAAKRFGADLVGFADPDRWGDAPFSRSPRALMGDCTAAITLGIHYLDSCIELGGSPDPRYPGPAVSNHIGSEHCNYAAFKLCKYIESLGYEALMVPSTGWWRYRETEDSPRGFSGDITHYYAAVAAGLGELGWNNLFLSPEFGPRQRLITLVTNAPVEPDPMYDGERLCDHCRLCEIKCPGQVFEKESNGPMSVRIGGREYTFQHKNLWRCACGENFQLDSFMDRPEHTDEETVLRLCEEAAHGDPAKRFTWKMGMCLKWCVPRARRYMDKSFAPSPRRRRDVVPDFSPEGLEGAMKLIRRLMEELEISRIHIVGKDELESLGAENGAELSGGISERTILPNCESVIAVMQSFVPGGEAAVLRTAQRNALWLARRLEIDLGYDTLIESGLSAEDLGIPADGYKVHLIMTNLPLESGVLTPEIEEEENREEENRPLREILREAAFARGGEVFGVTPVSRLEEAAACMDAFYDGYDYFVGEEQGWGLRATRPIEMKGKPKNPVIHDKRLVSRHASDYVPGAKSVIVVGMSFLKGSVKNVGKGPAPKAAHYGVTVHKEMLLQNEMIANHLALLLRQRGYRAAVSSDLDGLASPAYSWLLPGIRANMIPALCAGAGVMGKNGLVIHEKYGSKVRYVAVITDADIPCDAMKENAILCDHCDQCLKGCPAKALDGDKEPIVLKIEGKTYAFAPLDRLRCDWASRYGLLADEGPKYLGCTNDFPVPEEITRENLKETILRSDRLQITNFAPIVEHCLLDCPYNL